MGRLILGVVAVAMLAGGCEHGSSASSGSAPGDNRPATTNEPAVDGRAVVAVLTGAPDQITPAVSGGTLTWSQRSARVARAEYVRLAGGGTVRLKPRDARGYGGGVSGTTVVYQVESQGYSSIRFYDTVTHTYSSPPAGWNRTGWEWRPSVSGRFVLFGRTAPYAIGSTEQAYLGDRTTGELTLLTSLTGQYASVTPGQVNGNYAVWEECQDIQVQCDVYRYDIVAKTTTLVANTFSSGALQYAPSVTSTGTVYFVHSGVGCGASATLVRQPLNGSDTVLVSFKKGVDVNSTYVDDVHGTPSVYYSKSICADGGHHGDVYKIAG